MSCENQPLIGISYCSRCRKDKITHHPGLNITFSGNLDFCQCLDHAFVSVFSTTQNTEQLVACIMLAGGVVETPPEFQAIINKHFWELI